MTYKEEPGHLLGKRPRTGVAGYTGPLTSAWCQQEFSRGPLETDKKKSGAGARE